jgi:hypothetical protein
MAYTPMWNIRGGAPRIGQGDTVWNFSQFVAATGGKPLLRVNEQKLLRGPFFLTATLTDNAALDIDLTLASVFDKRVQSHYGTSASRIKAALRVSGIGLYVNSGTFNAETLALKESLDNGAYLRLNRGNNTVDLPLRGHIFEAISQFQFAQAAAAAETRGILSGRIWELERSYHLDLETDSMSLRCDTAINWAGGNQGAFAVILGHIGPRDFPGANIRDYDTCGSSPDFEMASVGPKLFGQLSGLGIGGGGTLGGGLAAVSRAPGS